MIARRTLLGLAALGGLAPRLAAQPIEARTIAFLYLDRAEDPFYQIAPGYTGFPRRQNLSPFPACTLALSDSLVAARAAGLAVTLDHLTLQPGEPAAERLAERHNAAPLAGAILDLALAETLEAAKAAAGLGLPLFNARHRDPYARSGSCAAPLFHTLPSWSMLTDALAQALLANNWRRALLLEGPGANDRIYAEAFAASAKKFGITLTERKTYAPGNDPRKRDQNNLRLLTAGPDHDVIAVADLDGDFGRTVAYSSVRSRPVVGTHGLVASAWHPFWERNGAPQLNRRHFRLTGRPMADQDWASWVAVRALIDAAQAQSASGPALRDALLRPDLRLELYKGVPGSFRPWDRQLRQPILVGTHDTVVMLAPVEGALHQRNTLDTLGQDEPEFRCDR